MGLWCCLALDFCLRHRELEQKSNRREYTRKGTSLEIYYISQNMLVGHFGSYGCVIRSHPSAKSTVYRVFCVPLFFKRDYGIEPHNKTTGSWKLLLFFEKHSQSIFPLRVLIEDNEEIEGSFLEGIWRICSPVENNWSITFFSGKWRYLNSTIFFIAEKFPDCNL